MNSYDNIYERFKDKLDALVAATKVNKLAHAFLLHSDLAETRENFALALAKIASCTNLVGNTPCGQCHSCKLIDIGEDEYFYTVHPEGKMFEIKVGKFPRPEANTIRNFTENFYLSNNSTLNRKIGIIYDADRMNAEAQNALLKTLEEPPQDSLIILTSGNPSMLLPTTLSRCQIIYLADEKIPFDFIGANELFKELWEVFNSKNDIVKLENSATKIIDIAANLKANATEKSKARWENKIAQAKEFDDKLAKRLNKSMEDAGYGAYIRERRLFLSAIHSFFAQLLLLANGVDMKHLANPEMFDDIEIDALSINIEQANSMLDAANELIYSFYFSVNEPLALRNFLFS